MLGRPLHIRLHSQKTSQPNKLSTPPVKSHALSYILTCMTTAREIFESFLHLDDKDDGIVSQLMFFVPLAVWITARILLSYSAIPTLVGKTITYDHVRVACITCLAIRELLFGKWDRLTLLGAFIFGWMAAMALLAKYNIAFDSIIFIFAGRNVRFDRLVKVMLITLGVSVCIILIAAAIGAIPDSTLKRGDIVRHQLGFSHPNTFPGIFLFIACSWIYMRDKRYGIVDALAILAISAALFKLTDARAACFVTAAVAVLALVVKWTPEKILRSKPLAFLGIGSVAICAIASIALTVCFDPSIEWMKWLNLKLSGRLQYGHDALVKHGIPLLGQKVDSGMRTVYDVTTGAWKPAKRTSTTIIDCEYMRFLIACGWPFMVAAISMCTAVCAKAHRNEQWILLLVIAVIAAHGIVENYGPYAFFDPFIFLLGKLFASRTNDIKANPISSPKP